MLLKKHLKTIALSSILVIALIFTSCGTKYEPGELALRLPAMTQRMKEACSQARAERDARERYKELTNAPSWWPDDVPIPESGKFDYSSENSGVGTFACTNSDIDKYEKLLKENGFPEMDKSTLNKKYSQEDYGKVEVFTNGAYDVCIWRPGEALYAEIDVFHSDTQKLVKQ
ncbi:MAG: hypothetical protein ACOX71_04740 [Lachnospiraceae bacterium]|jgi:hypothetical protein